MLRADRRADRRAGSSSEANTAITTMTINSSTSVSPRPRARNNATDARCVAVLFAPSVQLLFAILNIVL